MTTDALHTARRFDRGSWLIVAFVLAFALICITTAALVLRLPSDGCVIRDFSGNGRIVDACFGDWPTTLRPGDELIAIGGATLVDEADELDVPITPPPGWKAGGSIDYTVRRGGAQIELAVPIGQLSWAGVVRVFGYTLGDAIEEWLLYLSAALIFAFAPRSTAARLFFVAAAAHLAVTKLGWVGDPILSAKQFAAPLLFYINGLLDTFWIWIYWPSLLLLVLSFPRRVWPVARWPRLAPALFYLVPLGAFLTSLVVGSALPIIGVLLAELILLPLCLLVVTIDTFWRVHDPMVRAQTGWLLLGLACLIVPTVIGYPLLLFAPEFFSASFGSLPSLANFALTLVSALGLPLCLGIAITRYRLFDIEIIIRRTLVYSTLTLTLGLVYIGCIVLVRTLVAPLTGGTDVAIVASTLAIAALFNPLRKRIQTFIDKRFYRRKYDAAKVLAAFGATARDETDLEQLTAEMLHVVDETMQPEFVGLWLKEQS